MRNALLLTLIAAAPLAAQSRPAEFRVRYDRAGTADSAFEFAAMAPGWHFTTASTAAGIVWRSGQTATGRYRLETETHLFPREGHAEGFGLIFGGRDLDGPNQAYTYFLVRKDGRFLIKRRQGARTEDVVAWTAHSAVVPQTGQEGTARNVLAVEVGERQVSFLVNGQPVHRMPRAGLVTDGLVGLRVNHNLNLHVTRLEVADVR